MKVLTVKRIWAAAFLSVLALSILLFNWPKVRAYRQSVLIASALRGDTARMKFLLAVGAKADDPECETSRCFTPLVAAADAGRAEAAKLLIERGANVNRKLKAGQTALMFAAYHGHIDIVSLLLSKGADVNAECEGDTALQYAKRQGYIDIANLLMTAGARK
jgi:Ankyrin repeats (many copies)